MPQMIFVNLAVKDLNKSMDFYSSLGYTFNPQFTNEKAACLVISDTIFAMLLTEPFFQTFTDKRIIDAKKEVQALNCLSAESKKEVDEIVAKAIAAGGTSPREPQDYGFMYSHSFEDLDGHIWEYAYMDMSAFPPAQ
jgi:predicted lactoylglutathione lyase